MSKLDFAEPKKFIKSMEISMKFLKFSSVDVQRRYCNSIEMEIVIHKELVERYEVDMFLPPTPTSKVKVPPNCTLLNFGVGT